MNITKKRLLIYLGLSFGMAWLIFFIFIFTGHTWTGSSPEMLSLVSLGMLAPAIAHVITRKITNEGYRFTGEKSMMLGIDLKGKKWIFFCGTCGKEKRNESDICGSEQDDPRAEGSVQTPAFTGEQRGQLCCRHNGKRGRSPAPL